MRFGIENIVICVGRQHHEIAAMLLAHVIETELLDRLEAEPLQTFHGPPLGRAASHHGDQSLLGRPCQLRAWIGGTDHRAVVVERQPRERDMITVSATPVPGAQVVENRYEQPKAPYGLHIRALGPL